MRERMCWIDRKNLVKETWHVFFSAHLVIYVACLFQYLPSSMCKLVHLRSLLVDHNVEVPDSLRRIATAVPDDNGLWLISFSSLLYSLLSSVFFFASSSYLFSSLFVLYVFYFTESCESERTQFEQMQGRGYGRDGGSDPEDETDKILFDDGEG